MTSPLGWVVTPFTDVFDIQGGTQPPKSTFHYAPAQNLVRLLQIRDFGEHPVPTYIVKKPTLKLCCGDDVLIGRYGASVGRICTGMEGAYNVALVKVVIPSVLDRSFVYWLLKSPVFQTPILQVERSAQDGFNKTNLAAIPVCLPPFPEQQRIASKLEEVSAVFDSVNRHISQVSAILRSFRQAVLAAACSGRLTSDWRDRKCLSNDVVDGELALIRRERQLVLKKHPKESAQPNPDFGCEVPESWRTVSLDELTVRVTSGSRDWKKYYRSDGTGTFIMAQNVRPLFFDRSFRLAVSPPPHDRDRERSRVAQGDILVTIVGANTGDVCRVPEALRDHYVCQSVALIRPVRAEISCYLELYLNSPSHGQGQFKQWIYGEGRPHLSFDQLRQTAIMLPPVVERQEIVRRVHALFSLADLIENRIRATSLRTDRLIQSILAKAFRGELVPTEANLARHEGRDYEPASVLLERIRAERANPAKTPPVPKRKLRRASAHV